jgi:hypothetical protein
MRTATYHRYATIRRPSTALDKAVEKLDILQQLPAAAVIRSTGLALL